MNIQNQQRPQSDISCMLFSGRSKRPFPLNISISARVPVSSRLAEQRESQDDEPQLISIPKDALFDPDPRGR